VDAGRCATIHDLRKAIRELRYSMELFQPLYEDTGDKHAATLYAEQLARLVSLQGAIGTMHDVEVALQAKPRLTRCGALVAALRAAHDEAWHAFVEARQQLVAPQGRAALTAALMAAGGGGDDTS
jgi:CHAD domain-containing protein